MDGLSCFIHLLAWDTRRQRFINIYEVDFNIYDRDNLHNIKYLLNCVYARCTYIHLLLGDTTWQIESFESSYFNCKYPNKWTSIFRTGQPTQYIILAELCQCRYIHLLVLNTTWQIFNLYVSIPNRLNDLLRLKISINIPTRPIYPLDPGI